jgi:hypothetical protein
MRKIREERFDGIVGLKMPKMGSITPKNIEVPEIGDLLGKIRAAVLAPSLTSLDLTDFKNSWNYRTSFDFETKPEQGGRCRYGCGCLPCRCGDCGNCTVDAQRETAWDAAQRGKL